MKKFGLIFCLMLCMVFLTASGYAHRDDTTMPPGQQYNQGLTMGAGETQAPASKLTLRGFPCDCTGRWNTNWGEMVLDHIGDKVTGQYTHDQGKIEGMISGNSFSGRWSEAPTYKEPNDAGLVELEFSQDCKTFTGRWMYGTNGSWKENGWTGERINVEKSPF